MEKESGSGGGSRRTQIEKDVIAAVAQFAKIEEGTVKLSAKPLDYGLDSLQVGEMVANLEEDYSVEVPDEALEEMQSLADLVEFIDSRAQGG